MMTPTKIAVHTVRIGDRIETSNGMRRVISGPLFSSTGVGVTVEGMLSAMPDTIWYSGGSTVVVERTVVVVERTVAAQLLAAATRTSGAQSSRSGSFRLR